MSSLPPELEAAFRGRYRLVGDAGTGGMAHVYRAVDEKHGREVAIKVVRPELAAALGSERFGREIAVAARLNHPHLVPVFDSGEAGGHRYYVMPFIQGESLQRRLDREGRLDPAEALRITRDVATGLAHAHAAGIVHRDIKPANILLAGGAALLADFGIALPTLESDRLTATGVSLGTLLYMSPEQLAGDRSLDHRSDLYSLGAVLFEMVTGSAPHDPRTPAELVGRRLAGPPAELATAGGVPESARPVLRRLLALDPADRYASADELVRDLDVQPAAAGTGGALSRPTRVTIGVAAAAIAALLAVAAVWRPFATPPAVGNAPLLNQVAVLPFTNLSTQPDNEYFSDGLGEELIHALSRVPELRVTPRTSSWAYKGRNMDVRVLGDSLGVGAIIEGGVRQSGERLRVTARLIRAADGQPLWTGEFDERNRSDLFAIQDSIVTAIVGAIRTRLVAAAGMPTPADSAVPVSVPSRPFQTTDIEAHDLYLRARFEWNRRSAESVLRSIDLFRAALGRDSTYVAARTGLAEALAVAAFYDWLPPAEAFPEARRIARRTLELEPGAAELHATLGYVALWHDWDLPAAETEFRRAIALRPRYAQAHQWYANLLTAAGRWEEARASWREAAALDPLSMIMIAAQGWTEFYAGQAARAIEIERDAIARDPGFALAHYWMGLALAARGEPDAALEAFRRSAQLTNNGYLARTGIAQAFAMSGRRDSALAVLRTTTTAPAVGPVPAFEIATVHVALGDTDRALEWLDRAAAARSHSIALAPVDPRLAPLRGHPRFERLIAQVRRE